MKVLVVNCGSSTLKFKLIEASGAGTDVSGQSTLARGSVDRIGRDGQVEFVIEGGQPLREPAQVSGHAQATRLMMEWLENTGLAGPGALAAVGHRVVHGGQHFQRPTLIDERVIDAIEELTQLAPLHNGPSLQAIRSLSDFLDGSVPMVAVFDTAFHRTMPGRAANYAISQDLADKHQVRRYGFHGIAHQYMAERYSALANVTLADSKLVTLQLGNGCSACAVAGGRSQDTSMGLTPLEGLMMGTRSGDVDPTLPSYLARREGVAVAAVESWLNGRSGLLGVSGSSPDMRELLAAEQRGDSDASLAIEMFCYRAKKLIGAYLAALGGADAVVFGGGIGENSPMIRSRICAGMEWCGLSLDESRNAATSVEERRISTYDSTVNAYVIPVAEDVVIARDTLGCLGERGD